MQSNPNTSNLDEDGYRENVGIIICNFKREVLWARRSNHTGWQFPQGGIKPREMPTDAAYRELYEEVGLRKHNVKLLGNTLQWLYYDVPNMYHNKSRPNKTPFKGQKQIWFLFQLISDDDSIQLDIYHHPEFDRWHWINYWSSLQRVISFKKTVYRQALLELEPLLSQVSK